MFFFLLEFLIFFSVNSEQVKILYNNQECNTGLVLLGEWCDDLIPIMEITNISSDNLNNFNNRFSGRFYPSKGSKEEYYPLYGTFNYQNCSTIIGMNVIFLNEKFDSGIDIAWSGQLKCVDGHFIIKTNWILSFFTGYYWSLPFQGTETYTKTESSNCSFLKE